MGHNPYFDKRFIAAFVAKYSSGSRLPAMPMLDTRQLAMALFWPNIKKFSLDSIRALLNLSLEDAHTAKADAYLCREIVHLFDKTKNT